MRVIGTAMKSERYGFLMIAVSLLVVGSLLALLHLQQRAERSAQIRAQGLHVARLLARMPESTLRASADWHGPLQLLQSSQSDDDFAYVTLSRSDGEPLASAAAEGVVVPWVPLPSAPSDWIGERRVAADDGPGYREFHAPLLVDGELRGQVRIGYRDPGWLPDRRQLSFLAGLALPVFLMAALFYALVRREARGLQAAGDQVSRLLADGVSQSQPLPVQFDGELGEFVARVNRALEQASGRVATLEGERRMVETSSRVLVYRQHRAEAILDALPEGVLVLDESGAVSFANEPFRSLFRSGDEPITGRHPQSWCEDAAVCQFLVQAIGQYSSQYNGHFGSARGTPNARLEVAPPGKPQGRVALSAHPLPTAGDGQRSTDSGGGTLVLCRDITAEIMARQARSDFVANVAHELKNPLQIIAMHAESLQGEDGADEALRIDAANVIHDQIDHVSALVHNMLSITRIEMGSLTLNRSRTKVDDLLNSLLDSHAASAREAGLRLGGEFPQNLSPGWLDKDLLRVALNNLITNAIKYNRAGGEVVLGAAEFDDGIKIWVQDSGIGIAADQQSRVFDKFYRADDDQVRQRAGHGLGLSLVREVVELHGGELLLDSQPGTGSTFTIVLHATTVPYRKSA